MSRAISTIFSFLFGLLCFWKRSQPWLASTAQQGERTILVLGSLGVGKSSLVNMLIGKNIAPVSSAIGVAHPPIVEYTLAVSDLSGGAPTHPHPPKPDLTLRIYDTVGLEHRPSPWGAIKSRLKRRGKLDLVLYCMRRGRLTSEQATHLRDISKLFDAPMVLIVCSTDYRRGTNEKWWEENGEELTKAVQVSFADHICLNTWDSAHPSWEHHGVRYEETQKLVRGIVLRYCGGPHSD